MTLTLHKNVVKLISEALELSPEADVDAVVNMVLMELTPEDYEAALRDLLKTRVVIEMGYHRRHATYQVGNAKPNNQSKREAIRAAFFAQKMLTAEGFKTVGEMTPEDVRWAAQYRYERAAQIQQKADQLTALASKMEARGVQFVREMDYEDIHEVFEE